ncbi:hypothetical protein K474DRAFT_931979 [Panus rudis PR-1116 ss-1]|nr:hypothetical protein K474DRAFT_931979 [Panus rudis PR-1116 ss-1]
MFHGNARLCWQPFFFSFSSVPCLLSSLFSYPASMSLPQLSSMYSPTTPTTPTTISSCLVPVWDLTSSLLTLSQVVVLFSPFLYRLMDVLLQYSAYHLLYYPPFFGFCLLFYYSLIERCPPIPFQCHQ